MNRYMRKNEHDLWFSNEYQTLSLNVTTLKQASNVFNEHEYEHFLSSINCVNAFNERGRGGAGAGQRAGAPRVYVV